MRVLTLFFFWLSVNVFSQIPDGYYDSADGLSGQELRAALQQIIDGHEEQTYSSIWTHFLSTDADEDGMVWDMYSDVPGGNPAYIYTFIEDQCGNYSSEGDCYNREHSFPKSWFDDAAPMVTDIFQIYPTDGFVNGKRSNYPYGEVANPNWISTNGCRLGNCSYAGYSGTVFEPIDEYKGDFARTYFYMMTRYMDIVSTWNSDMLDGGDLALWAKQMLLEWEENDPVSQKETDRNNAVYLIQDNRNPFIDHPEYADLIWNNPSYIPDLESEELRYRITGNYISIESRIDITDKITVYNISGTPLAENNGHCNEICLPSALNKGIYFIVLQGKSSIKTGKFVF